MTLREKIDGLHTAKTGWVKLADVLRIVAEHERQQVCAMCEVELNTEQAIKDGTLPVLDLTPGMQPRKGGGADSGRTASGRQPPNVTAPPVGQAGDDQYRPMSSVGTGLTWTEVEQMARQEAADSDDDLDEAKCDGCGGVVWLKPDGTGRCPKCNADEPAEVPRWRRELERLRATIGQEPDPLSMADHRRLAALIDLTNLADIIAAGRGQAVVPDGVLRELWPESPPKPMIATWRSGDLLFAEGMRQDDIQGMNDRVHDILDACDTVGDSLCGAP